MAETHEECSALFKKFINRFLMLRNPFALDDFRLRYRIPGDLDVESEDAKLWIRHALQCNARCVKVTIWDYNLRLDPAVFTSGRFLRRLQLSGVCLSSGFFRQLGTGCKALKRLILRGCGIYDVEITSETLEVLTIDMDCFFAFEEQPSISIPSLVYLHFAHETIPLLKNMESLEIACVLLYNNDTQVDYIRQFLKSLSGVTDLDFKYKGNMLKMQKNMQWCPKFNNLTTLTLGEWCLHPDFYPLTIFLQNSPNLKGLTLELDGTGHKHKKFVGVLEESSFRCEQLDSVDIVCWGGLEDVPVLKSLEEFLSDNDIDIYIQL